jgi:hypothetical protein
LSNQKECKKSCKLISKILQEKPTLFKASMCSLGELDEKANHIKISKTWNFEPNGSKGKYSFVYTNLLVVYIH